MEALRHGFQILQNLLEISAGILHADDVGDLRQASYRGGRQVHARARGDVVQNDRQADRRGDFAKMRVQALLRHGREIGAYDG